MPRDVIIIIHIIIIKHEDIEKPTDEYEKAFGDINGVRV